MKMIFTSFVEGNLGEFQFVAWVEKQIIRERAIATIK